MEDSTDVYDRFNLYVSPEMFCIEPLERDGGFASDSYMKIDRDSDEISLQIKTIYGVLGVVKLVSGCALITITNARLMGSINGQDIWLITDTELIPYKRTTLHLNERQRWYNKHFTEMIQLVLATGGFYFSRSFDLSHSLQWLEENTTPNFKQQPMMERADKRFVWNRYLSAPLTARPELRRYVLPVIHGFFSCRRCVIGVHVFHLILISRRSVYRAGTRFYMRGSGVDGNSANFVETEQIIQYLTSFLQTRGSIPLYWSQKPNLRWQPDPFMKPADDQVKAFVDHMENQRSNYGGKHVIVNLVNQRGREKRVGGELERVVLRANLDYVRHNPFDFHRECHGLNWDRLSLLRDQIRSEISAFGFFASTGSQAEDSRQQTGFFRTNCMDCLDRTNVAQAMIAKESLHDQLVYLGIIEEETNLDDFVDFVSVFKNLWADNGDECSKQYAGTPALKADYTRVGKRTWNGMYHDAMNAIIRYFRNNFADGYRQDAIDLFLGNFRVDIEKLPPNFETTILNFDYHGWVVLGAIFAAAMMMLCVLVAESIVATVFWLIVFLALMFFIYLNGAEFVNAPKLKTE
ncbi:unnamed protein product [Enterobius vermicularis]|uniref:Phosphatidylinositol-3-phosphatase SAC1 n=1 Tax=Enterobius vermicularis TaxID=51028 RepID=A0A0N4V9Y6_ENTVE|nr:unnamed protein product [Enterobius vermicularis]